MDKIELKANLHQFINQLDNNDKTWDNLSLKQQQEILLAYQDSESDYNLIDNELIINRIKIAL